MEAFEVGGATGDASEPVSYVERIRVPALSVGVYRIATGHLDPQEPHEEDEVYHVVSGSARILVGPEDAPVGPGSVVFVPARLEHRFVDVTEDLVVLVFFSPAES